MRLVVLMILCVTSLTVQACVSTAVKIETAPITSNEKALGEASGSSTGVLLFGFIPIKQNSRFHNAYNQAIDMHPGTTRLVDPVIQEQWFWAFVLNGFTFNVKGTAVGPK